VVDYHGACCETASVSFHENFWLAASTAAPVITLAVVVVIPDTAGIRFQAERKKRALLDLVASTSSAASTETPPVPTADPDRAALERQRIRLEWAVRVTRRNVRLCYANLMAQAALLAVSLVALAYSRDFVPPWLAIVVAVGGVGLLAWNLLRGAGIRYWVERAIRESSGEE
jgi:hypothetical protein